MVEILQVEKKTEAAQFAYVVKTKRIVNETFVEVEYCAAATREQADAITEALNRDFVEWMEQEPYAIAYAIPLRTIAQVSRELLVNLALSKLTEDEKMALQIYYQGVK